MTTHSNASDVWKALDWAAIEQQVFKLQVRIHAATLRKDRNCYHKLMRLVVHSRAARLLAVHKVAEENKGADTAGIDGVKSLSPSACLALASELSLESPIDPVLRRWIPKKNSAELRPLGIPTMRARAQQALLVIALDPWFEAIAEPHVYGYRRGRGCADALERIRANIARNPRWVLDADIEKFFDRVNHSALMAKVDAPRFMKDAIKRMLRARIFEQGELIDPETGTPQGGVLSPLLANLALHGLEQAISEAFPRKRPILCVRYADDFVVLTDTREDAEAVRTFIADWLRPLGLNLKDSKTRVTHTLEGVDGGKPGFEFLGVRVWQKQLGKYGGRATFGHVVSLLHPTQRSISAHIASLGELFRTTRNPEGLITHANRKIRGWTGYFRQFNAKRAFSKVDSDLWYITWKWTRRNFKQLGKRERAKRFYSGGWCFEPAPGFQLMRHTEVAIQHRSLVRPDARYYSADWCYWASRTGDYPLVSRQLSAVLHRQSWKCSMCGAKLTTGQVKITTQGKGRRLIAVHPTCCPPADSGGRP